MDLFAQWFEALEKRHLQSLSFQEVRRSVQSLSSLYVERRERLGRGNPFDGVGKRAAFAYYFAPLHFLLLREIVRALNARNFRCNAILDLGCGTGIAGAAWALELEQPPKIIGIDRHPWPVQEARWTHAFFGLKATSNVGDITKLRLPSDTAVVAAFTMNELSAMERDRFQLRILEARARRTPVLIVEPIAKRLTPWWDDWAKKWTEAGGREDEWRFRVELPERLALMDKAAGLDHRELKARSLWLP